MQWSEWGKVCSRCVAQGWLRFFPAAFGCAYLLCSSSIIVNTTKTTTLHSTRNNT